MQSGGFDVALPDTPGTMERSRRSAPRKGSSAPTAVHLRYRVCRRLEDSDAPRSCFAAFLSDRPRLPPLARTRTDRLGMNPFRLIGAGCAGHGAMERAASASGVHSAGSPRPALEAPRLGNPPRSDVALSVALWNLEARVKQIPVRGNPNACRAFPSGPGRTRTCDRRIMSYVSGVEPSSAEGPISCLEVLLVPLSSRQFGRYFGRWFRVAPDSLRPPSPEPRSRFHAGGGVSSDPPLFIRGERLGRGNSRYSLHWERQSGRAW